MGMMKNVGIPILEELAYEPGTRMDVFNRVQTFVAWEQFKRILSALKAEGLVVGVEDRLELTPSGKEVVTDFGCEP